MSKKKEKNIKVSAQAWLARSKKAVKIILILMSSKIVHWIIIGLLLLVSIWLLHTNMWLPLNQEKGLPQGISPRNPEIQEELLHELHVQRAQRVQHSGRSFINATNYFVGE